MYTHIKIDNKEIELKLTARNAVDLEDALGGTVLTMFLSGMPKLKDLLTLIKYSSNIEDEYDFYDKWIAEGKTYTELVKVGMDILRTSGFIRKSDDSKN